MKPNKPFMPNPGVIGSLSKGQSQVQPIRITLDILPNGNVQFSSSKPIPMLSVIAIFAGMIKEGATTVLNQQSGIIQVPSDVKTEPESDKIPDSFGDLP